MSFNPFEGGGSGGGGQPGSTTVLQNTTAYWDAQTSLVSAQDVIYVYTDHYTEGLDDIPAIKVGDGTTLLINLPFVNSGGITDTEREAWDEKVAVDASEIDEENLIFFNTL